MTDPDFQRIEELFHETAALPAGERAAHLDEACAGDPRLRDEVETLLRSSDESGGFLETPVALEASELVLAASRQSLAGEALGPYRILHELGHGGMGEVYLAERADDQFRMRVAIKMIRTGVLGEAAVRRFHRERQILADLDHPGITRLLDGGTSASGRPYLVMEYVEGVPIDRWCDERDLSLEQRVRLFLEVTAAVEYAHRKLVVHRDIKHGNILVTGEGAPKLLDFGIARILEDDAGGAASAATADGAMTPDYASPEQVRGEAVTTATDVYSLGVLLYRLLTGQPPYALAGSSAVERLQSICEVEPERPSGVVRGGDAGAKRSRRLRGDLDRIVLTALRKEPERRYASVEQLSADLRRHLAGEPIHARPPTLGYRSARFIGRHRLAVTAAVLLFVTLFAGIVATTRQAAIARRERDEAVRQMHRARRAADFVQRMLSAADPYAQGGLLTVPEVLDEASLRAGVELSNDPELEAEVRTTLGLTWLNLGSWEASERELRRALEVREERLGPDHVDVARSLHHLCALLLARGAPPRAAEPGCRRALLIARSAGEEPLVAAILNTLGGILGGQGLLPEAEAAHRESLELRRRVLGPKHPDVAESLNDLAVVLGLRGELERAEALHVEALEIIREALGPEHPQVAAALSNLATIRESRGELEAAESTYWRALELRRRVLGDEHPDLAWTRVNLASLLYTKGAYAEGAELADEVLAGRSSVLPDEHPTIGAALLVRGRCLLEVGWEEEALRSVEECLAVRRRVLPEEHWLLANTRSVLGECLARLGRLEEAAPLLEESAAHRAATLGSEHERAVEAAERVRRYSN